MIELKNRYAYIALLSSDERGISIEFPDLPGCLPCARDMDEALDNAKEALGLHLWGMEQDGEDIPEPTKLNSINVEPDSVPVLVDVFMPPIRDRMRTKFVTKTVSLPAWLADEANRDGVNISGLLQKSLMDYLDVRAPKIRP